MLTKNHLFNLIQNRYPDATLLNAVYQYDLVLTEFVKNNQSSLDKKDALKYICSCSYIDELYFSYNLSFESFTIPKNSKLSSVQTLGLNFKQMLSLIYLAIYLYFDIDSSNDNISYTDYIKSINELTLILRPFLWKQIHSFLD